MGPEHKFWADGLPEGSRTSYLQWVGPGGFEHIQVRVTGVHVGLQAAAGIKDAICIWWDDRFQTGVDDAVSLFLWRKTRPQTPYYCYFIGIVCFDIYKNLPIMRMDWDISKAQKKTQERKRFIGGKGRGKEEEQVTCNFRANTPLLSLIRQTSHFPKSSPNTVP